MYATRCSAWITAGLLPEQSSNCRPADIGGPLTNPVHTTVSNVGAVAPSLLVAPRPSAVDTGKREKERPALKSGATRVRTTRIKRWESVSDLEAAWNGLLNRSPGYSVFQAFQWHLCWWKAFGAPHELFVILAYAGPQLVGIAPMMIATNWGPAYARITKSSCGAPNAFHQQRCH